MKTFEFRANIIYHLHAGCRTSSADKSAAILAAISFPSLHFQYASLMYTAGTRRGILLSAFALIGSE